MRILLFLIASTAFAAFNPIAAVKQINAGTASAAIDTSGADFLIAATAFQSGTVDSLGDSKGNTWVSAAVIAVSAQITVRVWYVAGATVGTGHTFTCSGSANFCSVYVQAFSGGAAAPVDQTITNSNAATGTIQAGSITPTCTNELAVSGLATEAAGAPTVAGATLSNSNQTSGGTSWGGGLAYTIQTTAAAFNPTWTVTGSAFNAAASVSFKGAASVCASTGVKHKVIGGM